MSESPSASASLARTSIPTEPPFNTLTESSDGTGSLFTAAAAEVALRMMLKLTGVLW